MDYFHRTIRDDDVSFHADATEMPYADDTKANSTANGKRNIDVTGTQTLHNSTPASTESIPNKNSFQSEQEIAKTRDNASVACWSDLADRACSEKSDPDVSSRSAAEVNDSDTDREVELLLSRASRYYPRLSKTRALDAGVYINAVFPSCMMIKLHAYWINVGSGLLSTKC